MATTETEIKRLWGEIEKIKKQVARLKRSGNGKRRGIPPKRRRIVSRRRMRARNEGEIADEILRRTGMLAELTPEEKAMAAEWRALPQAEKQRVRDELWNLKLEKPLSQIIIENR